MQGRHPLTLGKFTHVGVVVKDIEKAADFYAKNMGLGPFKIDEYSLVDVITRGKQTPYTMKVAFAPMGAAELELIQIVKGETLHTEFLREKGEGVHHLGFEVADLPGELAKAKTAGIEVLSSLTMKGLSVLAYLDSRRTNGVLVELVQTGIEEKLNQIQ